MVQDKSDGYEQDDLVRRVVSYTLMRTAVLLMLVLLSAFAGAALLPGLATFVPVSAVSFKEFLTDTDVGSVFGIVVVCLGLALVFGEDGRRHAAYGSSTANAAASILLIYIFYYIPAVFRDSFAQEGRAELFYKVFYYSFGWSLHRCGTFTVGVLVGVLILITASFGAYLAAYVRYKRKYFKNLYIESGSRKSAG